MTKTKNDFGAHSRTSAHHQKKHVFGVVIPPPDHSLLTALTHGGTLSRSIVHDRGFSAGVVERSKLSPENGWYQIQKINKVLRALEYLELGGTPIFLTHTHLQHSKHIYIYYIYIPLYSPNSCYNIPVVPHKAVAEVSKIGNLL
jgi:hypothetical protein